MDFGGLIAAVPAGGYISIWKLLPLLIVVLIWARLLTWIDKDAPSIFLPRVPINLGMLAGFVLGLFLFFALPGFVVSFIVLFVLMLIDVSVYLFLRNQKAGLADLQSQFKAWLGSIGGRRKKEVKAPPGDVLLQDKGGNALPAPAADDPDRPAYDVVQSFLTEPLRRFAESIQLGPTEQGFGVRYVVDGVVYNGASIDKTIAASAINYLKPLAGLDGNEKRKPQTGTMKLSLDGKRKELMLETRGSSSGEQATAEVDPKHRHGQKLDELGFDDKQLETIRELIVDGTGVVLVAAPKGQGLTSSCYAILRAHDAFLSHIQTVEPEPDLDLEGITQNKLTSNPAEDGKLIEWVISQEPDVMLITRLEDTKAAVSLSKFAASHRVYVGVRASTTFEALGMWRKLVGDDRTAMKNLKLVIAGRVMRRLCTACKVGYTPDPTTLRKLNMDPDRVGTLFQARTSPIRDPKGNPIPCEFCRELQYRGRIGVYETLIVNDELRAAIEQGGSGSQLKSLFRKQRGKYLQEQALARVEAGDTSVQEVLRIMGSGGGSSGKSSSGGGVPRSGGGGSPTPRSGDPSARPQAS